MLVLRRKAGQSLLIGDEIEIEVLEVNAQGAKIGIRAPRSTVVLRKELKIAGEQNRVASKLPSLTDLAVTLNNLRA
jgi:carbon storage regulator